MSTQPDPTPGARIIPFPTRPDAAPAPDHPGPAETQDLARPKRAQRKKKKKKEASGTQDKQAATGSRRGIETLYRTAYDTHLTLHAMADNKARMMIQVSGLILSVLLTAGASMTTGFDANPPPAAVALFVAGAGSLLFAVAAARPQGRRRCPRTGRNDPGTGGLLLFSEFSGMSRDDYVASMNRLIQKPHELYDNMSGNLYVIGQQLERKYKLLRVSYAALAVGVVAAVGAWIEIPAEWLA